MRSIRRYVENHGISVEIVSGPDWAVDPAEGGSPEWEHYAYEIKLINADLGTEMTLPWKHGTGITEGPDERPEQVFDSLIGDAWGYENARSFEEWAGEYDYDPDSRRAEATWKAVGKIANDFLDLIGGREELEKLALRYERL